MRTWLPALLIGLCLGFVWLRLPPLGLALALPTLIGLGFVYWRQHRLADVGWLLVGLGAFPMAMLGRAVLISMMDPGVLVSADIWVGLAAAALAVGVGLAVVLLGGRVMRGERG